jgi:hypothetical protein
MPPLRHTLRQLLVGQAPTAVKTVLNSSVGVAYRAHAETCADCADVIAEVYGPHGPPPVDETFGL